MQIKWIPVKNNEKSIYYEKISNNKLRVNDDVADFTDTSVLEYDIPSNLSFAIKRAFREEEHGELYLLLKRYYGDEDKRPWEGQTFEGDGLRGSQFETYSENGVIE
jgi:hypothetical protein